MDVQVIGSIGGTLIIQKAGGSCRHGIARSLILSLLKSVVLTFGKHEKSVGKIRRRYFPEMAGDSLTRTAIKIGWSYDDIGWS